MALGVSLREAVRTTNNAIMAEQLRHEATIRFPAPSHTSTSRSRSHFQANHCDLANFGADDHFAYKDRTETVPLDRLAVSVHVRKLFPVTVKTDLRNK